MDNVVTGLESMQGTKINFKLLVWEPSLLRIYTHVTKGRVSHSELSTMVWLGSHTKLQEITPHVKLNVASKF
jgi:hypothetical protein